MIKKGFSILGRLAQNCYLQLLLNPPRSSFISSISVMDMEVPWRTHKKSFSSSPYVLAGHAHWQNIKHTKGAKDAAKASQMIQMTMRIKMAVKSQGSADPKINSALAKLIEYGKSQNLSSDRLEKIAKDMLNRKTDIVRFDIKGPGGSFLIVEFLSDNQTRVRGELKGILRKSPNTSLADAGGLSFYFDQKGVIVTRQPDLANKPVDLDRAEEVAIECGAEEVSEGDQNGEVLFICDAMDILKVSKALETHKYSVIHSQSEYIPKHPIVLSEEDQVELSKFVAKLEDHPDFNNVYVNCQYTAAKD